MSSFAPPEGWLPAPPDIRDHTIENPRIREILEAMPGFRGEAPADAEIDLTEYMPPVEDQGALRASTAFAALSLVEYFERRCYGRALRPSKLFLYRTSLKLRRLQHDSGIDFRTTFKALTKFGTPPERLWPYSETLFDQDPSDGLLFGFSGEYKEITYARVDLESSGDGGLKERDWTATLEMIQVLLACGIPVAFGFSLPGFITAQATIPYSPPGVARVELLGGHALVAVGYTVPATKGPKGARRKKGQKGALKVRACWGPAWGDEGYGWLPFAYFHKGYVGDCWILLRPDWIARIWE